MLPHKAQERVNRTVAGGQGRLEEAHCSQLMDVCQNILGDLTGAGSMQEESCLHVLHLQQQRVRQLILSSADLMQFDGPVLNNTLEFRDSKLHRTSPASVLAFQVSFLPSLCEA